MVIFEISHQSSKDTLKQGIKQTENDQDLILAICSNSRCKHLHLFLPVKRKIIAEPPERQTVRFTAIDNGVLDFRGQINQIQDASDIRPSQIQPVCQFLDDKDFAALQHDEPDMRLGQRLNQRAIDQCFGTLRRVLAGKSITLRL